jgi:hypothetical protein
MSPAGLGPLEWLRWRGPIAIVNDRTVSHQRGYYVGAVKKILVVSFKGLGAKTN